MTNFLAERRARRNGAPHNPRRVRVSFARQATIDAFGWRFARALDQADFLDRPPDEFPPLVSGARLR